MVGAIGLCDWLVGFSHLRLIVGAINWCGLSLLAYLINSFWLVRQSEGLKWAGWDLGPLGKSTGFPELIVRAIDLSKIVGASFNKRPY